MNFARLLSAVFCLAALLSSGCGGATPEEANDFAILAQGADGYAQAGPGRALVFPRDHGPHPDYRFEWWYLTANLKDPDGRHFGAQWTLFRLSVQAPDSAEKMDAGQSNQLYMAHFAITSPRSHAAFQRYARGGEHGHPARSGVIGEPFEAWLDDWVIRSTGADWLPMEVFARQDDHSIRLELNSDRPLVPQGDAGFSQKHPNGGGSFYYSQPFLTVSGEVVVAGTQIPVSGQAWLDREWSSRFLQGGQEGWDWFSLHLENGEKLLLFQLRQSDAKDGDGSFRYGALMRPDGGTDLLNPPDIRLTVLGDAVVAGRRLPLSWRIELPQIGRALEIEALHPQQWMDVDFPYWEGVVTASGAGPENRGVGYMELTGYPVH